MKMAKRDLLKAPLLPNKQAAGVKLKAKAETVKELWGEPTAIETIRADHARWSYDNAWFWFKAEQVSQISVFKEYEGKTPENVGIGSTRAKVEQAYGPLEWDGCWLINGPPFGIGFDFGASISGEPCVTEIYIFNE